MECPKCGFVLIDDRWICENCGAEIQMVPDFELELENSINEVLLNVADEIDPRRNEEVSPKIDKKKPKAMKTAPKKKGGKWFRYLIIALCGIVFLAAGIPLSFTVYRNNSAAYQLSQARIYEESGDFGNALLHIAKADALRPNDAEIRLLWAAYCFSNADFDKAAAILLEMIGSPRYTWAEKDICYDNIIIIWHLMEKFQEINDLLLASRDEDLIAEYHYYLARQISFSEESGEFTGSLLLALNSEAEGKIYYTLDGTEPTRESRLYTAPILLEVGETSVAAVFENRYGILSDVTMQRYVIETKKPDPPFVPLSSGRYIEQVEIIATASDDCEIYFTADGSNPTAESELYEGPMVMALGNTVYHFVAINAEGICSDVVAREFEFRFNSDVTLEMAVANVFSAQLRRGRIVDMEGKAADADGFYDYVIDSLIEITDKGLFYKIYEHYYEPGGEPQITGHIFAASVYTGEAAHLVYNDYGVLEAIML